ncbi:MAG: four-carbon acid sugar kinase family protein [Syntrophobacter sp.]
MVCYAIIGDDLSGAGDTAVTFSNCGYRSFVINFPEGKNHILEECDVVAISTNSREMAPHEARASVVEACRYLKKLSVPEVYKKIDSTCRGHIGIELEAIMEELDLTFAVLCPAFPKTGRLVRNGKLLINGVALDKTAIAKDPGFPVRESYLPDILKAQTDLPVISVDHSVVALGPAALTEHLRKLADKGRAFILVDALDEGDLNTIASIGMESLPPLIFSGSAALAAAIARNRKEAILPGIPPIWIIVGSVHPQNEEMVSFLLNDGLAEEVYLDPVELLLKRGEYRAPPDIRAALRAHSDLVIRTCRNASDRERVKNKSREMGISEPEAAEAIACGLQSLMKEAAGERLFAGLIITGGATALHILRGFQGVGIRVEEELEPGVPLGRIVGGVLDGMGIITKAGGFGSVDTFANGIRLLKKKYMMRREAR